MNVFLGIFSSAFFWEQKEESFKSALKLRLKSVLQYWIGLYLVIPHSIILVLHFEEEVYFYVSSEKKSCITLHQLRFV